MTSKSILDGLLETEEENSDVDDNTSRQLDEMEEENNSENFDSTITINSVESLAIPDEVRDNYGEQKNLEITLRNVTDLSMEEVGDGCQDLWHNLSTCKHQTDWNTCHVTILPIHLPTWQANNPWINPAWLFQEMNRVLKTRLVSLTEHNAIISRCNAGLFFQMQQDQEKYERQLQDFSNQVKTFI